MHTAPEGGQILRVFEADGTSCLAVHHRDRWVKMQSVRDSFTGAVTPQMSGSYLNNPVAWRPAYGKK